jgi:membrane protein
MRAAALPSLLVRVARRAAAHRLTGRAAEIAFFAVLSLFPGLLLLAGGLGSLDALVGYEVARRSQEAVLALLGRVLTDRASGVLAAVSDLFERSHGRLLTGAALAALWALSRGFDTVIRALDRAYTVGAPRTWMRRRLIALAFSCGTVAMLIVVLAMLVVGPLFGHGQHLASRLGWGPAFSFAWDWLRAPLAFALLAVWAAALYRWAPGHGAPPGRVLPGALTAATLWLLVSLGLRVYLRRAGEINQVFGALGGGLILLVWLYLLGLTLLLGGEINAVIARRDLDPGI